ncbi:MAG TPA: CPBP family intramembrane glutamic endopeptidase, partial [Planctomycetota bacterium]|nr:CPBP family intramembrane glutamic endopeptidase [Planctomycetota bacterium]
HRPLRVLLLGLLPVPTPVVPLPLPYALLLVLGVYLLVDVTRHALLEAYPDTFRSQTVLGIVAMALPSIAASLLVLRLRARARQLQFRPPPPVGPSIRRGAWTYVVGSAAAVVAALVAKPILEWAGQEAVPQVPVLDAVMGPVSTVWLITAYGTLVAPFAEEALFRGLLHPAARVYLGARGATIGVAVLFALVHQNLFSFLPLFTLALFLGWLMEETDSLLATFTVHALFNATNLIPILLFRYA